MATFKPEEFRELMEQIKQDAPVLFSFITDFVNENVTSEEVTDFCSWSDDERTTYLEKRYGGGLYDGKRK